MTFRKVIAGIASVALLFSAAGCEQSSVAGFDPENVDTSAMTDEEKEQMREYLKKMLEELGETPAAETSETAAGDDKKEEVAAAEEKKIDEAAFYALDETGHSNHTLQELYDHYRGVDENALDSVIKELDKFDSKNTSEKNPEERVVELYHELVAAYEAENMQYAISELMYEVNTADETLAENKTNDEILDEKLLNAGRLAVKRALEGPYGKALKGAMTEREAEEYLKTTEMTARMEELSKEFSELSTQYETIMHEPVEVEFNGKKYSSDKLDGLGLSESDISSIKNLVQVSQSEKIWPVYQKVIQNRNEYAEERGYDNYLTYAYSDYYDRDYTAEDIKKLSNDISEYMTELLLWTSLAQGDASLSSIPLNMDTETIFKTIGENVSTLVPSLSDSMNYLISNKLYTCGTEAERHEGAFMMPLPAMRAGLIFSKRDNTAMDYETLTHEFGHLNNAYLTYTPGLVAQSHLDILEIHSQGLEMLGSTTLHKVFPDKTGDFTAGIAQSMVQNITSALMVARFEIMCFENPDMTWEEANAEFGRCFSICMLGMDPKDSVPNAVWVIIHHLFSSPLYYVSYSISALSALDIYAQYLEKPDEAIKKYDALAHIDPHLRYVEAMKEVGLRDMTKSGNIKEVASILTNHYRDGFIGGITEGNTDLGNLVNGILSDLMPEITNSN